MIGGFTTNNPKTDRLFYFIKPWKGENSIRLIAMAVMTFIELIIIKTVE